jgi:hypothetical protein
MMRSIIYQILEKNQELFRIYEYSYRQYRNDFSTGFRTFMNRWSTETNAPALLLVIDAMDEFLEVLKLGAGKVLRSSTL